MQHRHRPVEQLAGRSAACDRQPDGGDRAQRHCLAVPDPFVLQGRLQRVAHRVAEVELSPDVPLVGVAFDDLALHAGALEGTVLQKLRIGVAVSGRGVHGGGDVFV